MAQLSRDRLKLEIRRARGGFIALLALIALTAGCGVIIANGLRLNMPWQDTYTARIAVDDAKGVAPGKQQVRISGLPVGKISKAEIVDGKPVLTITLKGKYAPLYQDARLRLRPKTPLDDLYLNVESRGHKSAGEIDGQILAAERTRTPVAIGKVLNTFNADTRTRMEQAIDEIGRGLPDHGDEFRATLVKLAPFLTSAQRLTRETAIRRGATRRLIHNFGVMTEELGRRDNQLKGLVTGGANTFNELAQADQQLSRLLVELPPTLRQLQSSFATLRTTADELDPAFDALQPAARSLPGGLKALREFSDVARPSIAALRKPLPSLSSLVRRLSPTSTELADAFDALRPTAPRLDRITAAIVPCEFAVQKFFANTLSLMKFSDARGGIPRGQTVDGESNYKPAKSCAPGGVRK